jgi:hypothetical protein
MGAGLGWREALAHRFGDGARRGLRQKAAEIPCSWWFVGNRHRQLSPGRLVEEALESRGSGLKKVRSTGMKLWRRIAIRRYLCYAPGFRQKAARMPRPWRFGSKFTAAPR